MVRTSPSNAGGLGSIPGQGAKIPNASWPKNQNIKQPKQYCNKLMKTFKNDPHQKKKMLQKQENKLLVTKRLVQGQIRCMRLIDTNY